MITKVKGGLKKIMAFKPKKTTKKAAKTSKKKEGEQYDDEEDYEDYEYPEEEEQEEDDSEEQEEQETVSPEITKREVIDLIEGHLHRAYDLMQLLKR